MAGLMKYPTPRRSDTKDVLHGTTVADPYRWMEDPDAEETKAFVDDQNKISRKYLEKCPHKAQFKKNLTKLWNFPKFTAPFKCGSHYYFHLNSGLQNQYVLNFKKDLHGESEVFLDPNSFAEDGTISLSECEFSKNNKFLCYGRSVSGSDWSTLHVKKVEDKEDLPEVLERFRYSSVSWTHDEKGFFYGQYSDWTGELAGTEPKAVENQKVFYHRLSTPQSEDILCFELPEHPLWRISPEVSDCGRYLILHIHEGCKDNRVYVADISNGVSGVLNAKPVYDKFDCDLNYIANDGPVFYFHTNKDRPKYGIVKIDINEPSKWIDVIPEDKKSVLRWVSCADNDKLVVGVFEDVVTKVKIYNLAGEYLQTLPFDLGSVHQVTTRRENSELFFRFSSFTTPGTIYRCEIDKAPNAKLELFKKTELGDLSTEGIEVKQVFYESKDGTKVPMFITRKKGTPLDNSSPCLLYVYGGFNVPLQPEFSLFRIMLIHELNFTVAVANVRGGGEYGEDWHNAGRLANKQNTFDDVHAAAAYLADNGYTKPARLALMGGSNGGMVTTASVNQRPELFGAAIAMASVIDVYRFHKFTVGHAWITDYGNPDKKEDFLVQSKYSPLHNIPTGIDNYPNILLTTADHDDRVVPSHTLKFIAELQHRLGEKNKNPLLTLIDTKAGHGMGKPTAKVIDELVDIMCFLQIALNIEYKKSVEEN